MLQQAKLVKEFEVVTSPNLKDELWFRGFGQIVVDPGFNDLMMERERPIHYGLFQIEGEEVHDSEIRTCFTKGLRLPKPEEVRDLLLHLQEAGEDILDIPNGEEEVNIILGYILRNNYRHVLYVRHAVEDGNERIYLHCKLLSRWSKPPRFIMKIPD